MTHLPPDDPARRDAPATPAPLAPASPVRQRAARAARAGVSLIWAVPILALIVTLGLAWNAWSGRGTLVQVAFSDATGITPGETLLKFREIAVGKVEAVRFTGDLQQVVVDIRVDKDVTPYIDDEAEFWIVRPQVSTQGISRLDTVLTGVFIEGWWDAKPGATEQDVHRGLDKAPLTRRNEKGTWVTLAADSAKGMTEGAPVMYRGLTVGRMQNLRLSDKDETVLADVFIESPHDKRLTSTTVFWDVSGFSVSLGTQGVELNVSSIASLVQGGAEFATLSSGGEPVQPGHVFRLQPDAATAQSSLLAAAPEDELKLTVMVPEAVKGLSQGAEVQFQGLAVGRVTNLAVQVLPPKDGKPGQVMQDITIALNPQRLGLATEAGPQDALTFLRERVAKGLRARLTGAGFFGTSLMVELAELPDAPPAEIDLNARPFPILPAAPADLSDFTATAQGFMARIGNLPIEEALKSATQMMDSVTAIASAEDTRAIPGAVRKTMEEAQGAATDLRAVAKDLRDSGAATQLRSALDEAAAAAEAVKLAAADMPEMVGKIDAAAASIDEMNLKALGDEATGLVQDLRRMLGTEDAEQLPRNLSDTLKAASGLLNDLRDGNAAGSLNAALASARTAADNIAAAVQRVPSMTQRFEQLAARADGVVASYGERGAFNNEAVATMRALRRASEAFGSLATTIERNPRAFILGR